MADFGFADVLSLAQTLAIIATLVLTLYFSRQQLRRMAVDLETRVLNDLDDKLRAMGQLFIDRPQLLNTIYESSAVANPELPLCYYILFMCSHAFHMRARGVLSDNEWIGWLQWMKNAFRFGRIGRYWHETQMGSWFDPEFQAFVESELLGKGTAPTSPS
ncbi:MAG TPA: hypothetical protein VEY07_05080 [Thermoplasmata archaeon]|nr:hypothetical protein [Thermoplasmata archaeon]